MEIDSTEQYGLAVALLKFTEAWTELAKAGKALEDYDVSAMYPLYLLDFEEIAGDVATWAKLHAAKLFAMIPDLLIPPECLNCFYCFEPLTKDGLCTGGNQIECSRYPRMIYDRRRLIVYLGTETADASDEDIYAQYAKKVQDAKDLRNRLLQKR